MPGTCDITETSVWRENEGPLSTEIQILINWGKDRPFSQKKLWLHDKKRVYDILKKLVVSQTCAARVSDWWSITVLMVIAFTKLSFYYISNNACTLSDHQSETHATQVWDSMSFLRISLTLFLSCNHNFYLLKGPYFTQLIKIIPIFLIFFSYLSKSKSLGAPVFL